MSRRVELPEPRKGKNPMEPWDNAFFITINTNTNLPGLKEGLMQVWDFMSKHMSEFSYGRPGSRLLNVKQHARIEVGKKFHKIHLHGTLVFKTTGLAMLDFYKVNEFVNRNLRQIKGFRKCNFQAKLIKNYNQNAVIQKYIDKDADSDVEQESE